MKKPFAILWIGAAGILIFSWFYLPSLSKYHDLKQQQDELDKQIEKFTKEVETTREERDLLKNDPEYLEKVIRDEMGLVKPGEIIYKFVQDEPEEPLPLDEIMESPSPSPTPSPFAGVTVEAKPVSSAPQKISTGGTAAAVKKPLPANAEPVYPRRETR